MTSKLWPCLIAVSALMAGCATVDRQAVHSTFVVIGEDGQAIARAITDSPSCPDLTVDGRTQPMRERAGPATVPQRPTVSAVHESKPSVFPVRVCEADLPAGARAASIDTSALALPKQDYRRIVVIGDTGCRLKGRTNQDCNDIVAYPFATVAKAAASFRPELVIHVGDYHYRETACPAARPGCQGSSWGYGWDTWRDDLFLPGRALLAAAPWVATRGNHESCTRGGQGFMRFLDVRPFRASHSCDRAEDDAKAEYSAPFAVPLGDGAQLVVMDTANSWYKGFEAGDPRKQIYGDDYLKMTELTERVPHTILVKHQPMLALGGRVNKNGPTVLEGGDLGLIQAFGQHNPKLFPSRVHLVLSGHMHLWQQTGFSSDHPVQVVSGFAGTDEDLAPLPAVVPPGVEPAPGAVPDQMSTWVGGFGFMTLERDGPAAWTSKVWDRHGKLQNTCKIEGRRSRCALASVPTPVTP
jgi:hypothetical protein